MAIENLILFKFQQDKLKRGENFLFINLLSPFGVRKNYYRSGGGYIIVSVYKMGDKTDCSNYQCISLLSGSSCNVY
jgi:predicted AAA+ superfamily ATPase